MTTILYDAGLMEKAVRMAVCDDPQAERRLQQALSPIYPITDEQEREAGFRAAFADWFGRLGLDRHVAGLIRGFSLAESAIGRVVVRTPDRARNQGAELLVLDDGGDVGPDQRTLMIQVAAESLVEPDRSRDLLIRELQHVDDMLDDRFGYRPDRIEGSAARQQLVRDRYRVLWDIYVESRLIRGGRIRAAGTARLNPAMPGRKDILRSQFRRVFPALHSDDDAFDRIWNLECTSHAELLNWAEDPRRFQLPTEVLLNDGNRLPKNGDLCPCCGFPTHDWANNSDSQFNEAAAVARSRRPNWIPSDGMCRRCAETLVVR